jgi:hypothetical protein
MAKALINQRPRAKESLPIGRNGIFALQFKMGCFPQGESQHIYKHYDTHGGT